MEAEAVPILEGLVAATAIFLSVVLVAALLRQRTGKTFQKKLLVGAILLLTAAILSNVVISTVLQPQSQEGFIILSKRVQATFDILFGLAIGAFLVVTGRPRIGSLRDFRRYLVQEFPNSYSIYAFIMGLGLFSVLATTAAVRRTETMGLLIELPFWFVVMMAVTSAAVMLYIPYNLVGYLRRVKPLRRVARDTYLILLALEGYVVTEFLTEIAFPNLGLDIRTFGFLANVLLLALVTVAVRERGFLQELLVPVPEASLDTARTFHLDEGYTYLVPESLPTYSMEVFRDLVTHGVQGLCVTRQHPAKVAEAHGLEKTPILWLSRVVTDQNCVRPTPPENVAMAIDHFLEISQGSVVLLDGVEYLISHNDFLSILTLLHDLNERVSVANAILLLPVDPKAFDPREFNLLKRDLRVLRPGVGSPSRPGEGLSPEAIPG